MAHTQTFMEVIFSLKKNILKYPQRNSIMRNVDTYQYMPYIIPIRETKWDDLRLMSCLIVFGSLRSVIL